MTLSSRARLGALLLGTALSFAAFNSASAQVQLPAIFQGTQPGDSIYVDAAGLEALGDSVKLIDIRSAEDYAAGHIAGAISIPNSTLSIEVDGLRNQLPAWDELEAIFANAGLSYDDTIVIYGDNLAGRSFIAFDQSGFEKVHVLQGGFPGWTGPTSTEPTATVASNFQLTDQGVQIVDADYVQANIGAPGVVIIDSRDADSYRQGHIPGSISIPINLTHSAATVTTVEPLVAALAAAGVTPETKIITTCGTGNVASNQLALLRDLGFKNIVLYDGSWQEWGSDPSRPVETGG
ncbi:MAG: sulfurtransferase [Bauldia sp.]|nr:sulfurtransferase [Bauldia sp.]